MLTLSEAKNARRLKNISGLCPGSIEFLEALNDVVDSLMKRGSWWGTVKRVNGCVYNDCVVWPRQVSSVLALNRCNRSIPPKNHWYEFNDVLPECVRSYNSCCGSPVLMDGDTVSVFNQIPCLNDRYVRFYPSEPSDVSPTPKTITLFGIDSNGQTISGSRADGTIQDGVQLSLQIPFVQTAFLVRRIDRVIKDPTDGPVRGYQFDGKTLYDLASYEPSETLPEYRSSRISGQHWDSNTVGPRQISALVKLQFIPAVHDDDLIVIDDLEALAIGMQSIKQSDAYDHGGAEQSMARAVHVLNLGLRNKLGIDTIPARVHTQGTAHLRRVLGGFR